MGAWWNTCGWNWSQYAPFENLGCSSTKRPSISGKTATLFLVRDSNFLLFGLHPICCKTSICHFGNSWYNRPLSFVQGNWFFKAVFLHIGHNAGAVNSVFHNRQTLYHRPNAYRIYYLDYSKWLQTTEQFLKKKREVAWTILTALFLTGGLLTKGLVALAIPLSVLLPWYIFTNSFQPRKILNRNIVLLFMAIALAFILFSIWLLFVYKRLGMTALDEVVWHNNFGRFSGALSHHSEPFWYYFKKLPEQAVPWAIITPFVIFSYLKEFRIHGEKKTALMLCWLIFPLALLCAASGKRPIYLIPLHPSAAWAAGTFIDKEIKRYSQSPRKIKFIDCFFTVLNAAAAITTLIFLVFLFEKEQLINLTGFLPCIVLLLILSSIVHIKTNL